MSPALTHRTGKPREHYHCSPRNPMISLSSLSPAPSDPAADLIAHLAASGRPAIIHYTADDGRTELSGRVAVNWATKTTHLVDSYGIAAPDAIFVDEIGRASCRGRV